MASDSLQHAKDQAVLDFVEQAMLCEGEAIRSKCIAKTSKPIRVFGLKEKYANARNWLRLLKKSELPDFVQPSFF